MKKDQGIIEVFTTADQIEKTVYLDNNLVLTVWNIAWGYDLGEDFAHITTNISPEIQNSSNDFFYTNEIKRIEDRITGKSLFEREKPLN